MSADDALITAMHTAGGSTPRRASEWLELAQEHAELRDAFRATHGKRLPNPSALGLWLSERMGTTAGLLRLQGRHSAKLKAWIYRVIDYVKVAELARQEAERQAQLRAEFEAKQRAEFEAKQRELIRPSVQAHQPPPDSPTYEYEPQRYIDGVPQPRKIVIDPRTGEPVKPKPVTAAEPPMREQKKPEPKATAPNGRIPKIFINGQWRPMTEHEIEHSRPRTEPGLQLVESQMIGTSFHGNGVAVDHDRGWMHRLYLKDF